MIFKTHPNNIPQIQAMVDTFGVCYFHGDGNMYDVEGNSNFRRDFSNPKQEESRYRVVYKKGDVIPDTVEKLNEALMAARNKDIMAERSIKEVSGVKTVKVPVAAPAGSAAPSATPPVAKTQAQLKAEADEAELQRQIEEESKNKAGGDPNK